MTKCPTCGAPTNNAPDGDHRFDNSWLESKLKAKEDQAELLAVGLVKCRLALDKAHRDIDFALHILTGYRENRLIEYEAYSELHDAISSIGAELDHLDKEQTT